MDDALQVIVELNQRAWSSLKNALEDLGDDEIDWRPVPQSNSINVIVRHLRIEAQWHLDSLARGETMPSEVTPQLQAAIDAVPLDFATNLRTVNQLYAAFLDQLRGVTLDRLRQRTADAYGPAIEGRGLTHFLGYHQALHVTGHVGQIRMIRNLFPEDARRAGAILSREPVVPAMTLHDVLTQSSQSTQRGILRVLCGLCVRRTCLKESLMPRIVALLLLLLIVPSSASATWSVVAVDRSTGRVVIASATCVNGDDDFLKGVQAVVVPGKGVAACQAAVDNTHANQMLVFQELQKGTDPKQIIDLLSKDPAYQSRQFGIVDLQGRGAGHSGLSNGYVSQDVQGQVPGTEIFYSIQGNILRPGQVVPNAVQTFLKTTGAITDRVMAAMEAADGSGGDSRCTCPPWPSDGSKPAIPCDEKTAHVAYILMAEKADTNGDSHNNGKYAMYINVSQPAPERVSQPAFERVLQPAPVRAKRIKPGENLNPVKTLRMRYDAWRKTQPASFK